MDDRSGQARVIRQAGAIPYRTRARRIEILLITNVRQTQWTVPKGTVESGQTVEEAAALETWEEAGVSGRLEPIVIGSFAFSKQGRRHHVELFPLLVTEVCDIWPEMSQRQRCWTPFQEALRRVRRRGIRLAVEVLMERLALQRVA